MPKPRTKTQLLAEIDEEHEALEALVAGLTRAQLTRPNVVGHWAVKDVLAHLADWEQTFLGWYAAGRDDQVPALPAEGFNWRQLPELNQVIYERHCDQSAAAVLKHFRASFQQLRQTVAGMTEAELFAPSRYAWTGTNALFAYVVPNTSSHYRWARQAIVKGLRIPHRGHALDA